MGGTISSESCGLRCYCLFSTAESGEDLNLHQAGGLSLPETDRFDRRYRLDVMKSNVANEH